MISSFSMAEQLRDWHTIWDGGDVPQDIFVATFEKGTCREITCREDLAGVEMPSYFHHTETILDIMPYSTNETVFCEELGGDYLYLDITIGRFFDRYYGVDFADFSGGHNDSDPNHYRNGL